MKVLKHHWKENIRPLLLALIFGFAAVSGMKLADWSIPSRPTEYTICIRDVNEDYICKAYK